jgi:hypothetical protein
VYPVNKETFGLCADSKIENKSFKQCKYASFVSTLYSFLLALLPLWALASFEFSDLFLIGRIPWTNDQLVTRPLPKHRTTQTRNKHIYTPNINALSGIRTHDHSVPATEDSSCLRLPGCRDWPLFSFAEH